MAEAFKCSKRAGRKAFLAKLGIVSRANAPSPLTGFMQIVGKYIVNVSDKIL
jgi:thiazole synthase ThiGH ThiG subunit